MSEDNEKTEECRQKLCGAYVKANADVYFRLFTFSNVNKVVLQVNKTKAEILSFDMKEVSKGLWELTLENLYSPERNIRYRFELHFENGEIECVRDPYSMYQDSYFRWSVLLNHNKYNWQDLEWFESKDNQRISRIANQENGLKQIKQLSVYELHIGTLTESGTFESAKSELERIKTTGFNAIEIMPVENTYSFNWGYDGVDKFAPNHTYGKPDDLKSLIDYAHKLKLNVIMDIVPNHLGPDIADLQNTAPYIDGCNDFGYKFNFEKQDNCFVRQYIVNTALNWLANYHCDGLRVDMTKYMQSDYTMKMMSAEVQYYFPHAFLIAEDGRDNDIRVTTALSAKEQKENCTHHKNFIKKICDNNVSLHNIGFDSEWDFPFHKQIAAANLGTWEYFSASMENLDNAVKNSDYRVKYPMSHDEVGNIDGTRLLIKVFLAQAKEKNFVISDAKSHSDKILSHCAYRIIKELSNGNFEKMTEEQKRAFLQNNFFNLSSEELDMLYFMSVQRIKLALGKVYSCVGPKMVFQGEENINYSYFKFFRKFSIGREKCLEDKGYKPGYEAFKDSNMSNNIFDEKHKDIHLKVSKYMQKLNELNAQNSALTIGEVVSTVVHRLSSVHAVHCKKGNNEIYSISNFSASGYLKNYGIPFPQGIWQEILNSDDSAYYGTSQFQNSELQKEGYNYISIPPCSILFFKKIDI